MKFVTECNETTPEIVLYRFHEDYEIYKNDVKKSTRVILKRQWEKLEDRYGISDLWNVGARRGAFSCDSLAVRKLTKRMIYNNYGTSPLSPLLG